MSARSEMVPDRQEVASSLYGAWRLACLDESGIGHFNISVEGFWRSFFAAVLLAPVYMVAIGQNLVTAEGGFSFWSVMVHLITYVAGWVLFPLVAFFATDVLQLGHRFTALIVAVNWSSVLSVGVFLLSSLLAALIQGPLAVLLGMAVVSGVIVYHWFVIRTALETTTTIALAFVLFNAALGWMLVKTAERLI